MSEEEIITVEAEVYAPEFKDNVLTVIPKADDIFLVEGALKPIYDAVTSKLLENVIGLDATKKKDQKAIRSVAQDGRRNKTFIDDAGKSVKQKFNDKIKNIDPQRREAKQAIDEAIEKILKPVIAEEQREANRKRDLDNAINVFEGLAVKELVNDVPLTSEELQRSMVELNEITFESLSEKLDIKGENLAINCTKMACAKRLQGYIDNRVKYEADQAKLEEVRKKEEADEKIITEIKCLREIAKVEAGLSSLEYASLIYTMKQQPIDERYGDRIDDAQDIKDLCIVKLERAQEAAKSLENKEAAKAIEEEQKRPSIDNVAIDAELSRWSDKVDTYLAHGVSLNEIESVIDAISNMVLDLELFGERIAEAKEKRSVLVAKLVKHKDSFKPKDVVEDVVEEVTIRIAIIISEILGCDVSDSLLVVESMVEGKLSDFITIN